MDKSVSAATGTTQDLRLIVDCGLEDVGVQRVIPLQNIPTTTFSVSVGQDVGGCSGDLHFPCHPRMPECRGNQGGKSPRWFAPL